VLGWLMLLLVPRRYRLPVLLVAVPLMLFVAWTRIYVGDHSLLEIVAGLLLAATFLPLAAALMRLSRPRPGQ
jgi:membrane-associated phospholipid phosphatase